MAVDHNKVCEIAFAATARGRLLLAAGGEYGEIDVWDVQRAGARRTQRVDSRPVWLLAFSSRGSVLAASDSKNMIRLWSLDQPEPEPMQLSSSTEHAGDPGFLAFGGNGRWLASGAWLTGDEGKLYLWDLDVDSLRRKACTLLRRPGDHGAETPMPVWPEGSECYAP